jgi:hypothetical protein
LDGRTGRGGRVRLAPFVETTLLLLGDAVVIRNLPRQVVRADAERECLGWSKRAEEDSERG